jgi:hypothetical protein
MLPAVSKRRFTTDRPPRRKPHVAAMSTGAAAPRTAVTHACLGASLQRGRWIASAYGSSRVEPSSELGDQLAELGARKGRSGG